MIINGDNREITNNIVALTKRFDKVDENFLKFAKKNNFAVVNITSILEDYNKTLECTNSSVLVARFVFDLLPDKNYMDKLNNTITKLGKKLYIFTDNIIDENYKKFSAITIFFVPELLGPSVDETDYDFEKFMNKKKLYNCFMQRIESTRQSWFYKLYSSNLLEEGYVSFLLYQIPSHDYGNNLFEFNHFNYGLNNLKNFHDAYLDLKDKVPFRNFDPDDSLEELTIQSKYSLVLETYATEDNHNCICFTEKIYRSLQLPTIDLIFCQKNGYSALQQLSFELEDHASIDNLPWQERQNKLLDIIRTDSCDVSYKTLCEKAKHNKNLLLGYKEKILSENFFDYYLDIIKN